VLHPPSECIDAVDGNAAPPSSDLQHLAVRVSEEDGHGRDNGVVDPVESAPIEQHDNVFRGGNRLRSTSMASQVSSAAGSIAATDISDENNALPYIQQFRAVSPLTLKPPKRSSILTDSSRSDKTLDFSDVPVWLREHLELFADPTHVKLLGARWRSIVQLLYEHEKGHDFKVRADSCYLFNLVSQVN
jgi:hypothetical protein